MRLQGLSPWSYWRGQLPVACFKDPENIGEGAILRGAQNDGKTGVRCLL
jgi:hypothetical protein